MKTALKSLFAIVLFLTGVRLAAQTSPDIIWATNAHSEIVSEVALSADGTHLASCSPDHYWNVWSLPVGTLIRSRYNLNVNFASAALSSDGSFLATGDGGGGVRVWRVSDGGIQWQAPGDGEFIYSMIFSHDNTQYAVARGNSGLLGVGDALTGYGYVLDGLTEIPAIYCARFSPDDAFVASCGADQTAKLWRLSDRSLQRTFIGHSNSVGSVDFSPDGRLLTTASADGTARIWNVTNAEQLVVMNGGGGVAKFTADGKYLFSLSDGTFKIWRVNGGACVGSITNTGATTFDIAKNGKYFAYGTTAGTVVLARMPLVLDSITRTGNQTVLQWQGGSGLYQL